MAIFDVFVNGKVVDTFEAEDFMSKENEFIFFGRDNETVGSIVKSPGMSVKKVLKSAFEQRY
jgi:hypothetical protein